MFHIHEYGCLSYSQVTTLRVLLQNDVSKDISALPTFISAIIISRIEFVLKLIFARLEKQICNCPAVTANTNFMQYFCIYLVFINTQKLELFTELSLYTMLLFYKCANIYWKNIQYRPCAYPFTKILFLSCVE